MILQRKMKATSKFDEELLYKMASDCIFACGLLRWLSCFWNNFFQFLLHQTVRQCL